MCDMNWAQFRIWGLCSHNFPSSTIQSDTGSIRRKKCSLFATWSRIESKFFISHLMSAFDTFLSHFFSGQMGKCFDSRIIMKLPVSRIRSFEPNIECEFVMLFAMYGLTDHWELKIWSIKFAVNMRKKNRIFILRQRRRRRQRQFSWYYFLCCIYIFIMTFSPLHHIE